ncbi:HDL230Wp [Eremothecium sinecaudum]|uniref:HDL230Wp n=1 Tax=Eremothecium sinecaudum TaxID=45286 RepID=A0A0X8HSA0_9SACH|nr:HDL230Wp [Eremothecium sinecaudum]AMD20514.1 HDL230Wp [Eremothecium sinecaudum]
MSNNNSVDYWKQLSQSPVVPWFNSALLFFTPLISPAVEAPASIALRNASGLMSFFSRPKYFGPTAKTSILFGAAQALGGFILQDGDAESGSGFLAAWSTLYMLVGGRGSLKALRYGRVWPLLLSSISSASAVLYGRRFLTGHFE